MNAATAARVYNNRLKDRSFQSAVGPLALRVPQTRESDEPYRPSMLERGWCSDRLLKVAIAEMYLGLKKGYLAVGESGCGQVFCFSL
jgi:transposase-like protein